MHKTMLCKTLCFREKRTVIPKRSAINNMSATIQVMAYAEGTQSESRGILELGRRRSRYVDFSGQCSREMRK